MSFRCFDRAYVDELSARAARAPRLRQHANLHVSYEEPCQRLFNAIEVDSYIRPHRHKSDPKTETLLAVHGVLTLVLFDESGGVTEAIRFGADGTGSSGVFAVELQPGTWHTVLAEIPGSVLFEVKAGPFDPQSAKEFASWAPDEGDLAVPAYMSLLRQEVRARLSRT